MKEISASYTPSPSRTHLLTHRLRPGRDPLMGDQASGRQHHSDQDSESSPPAQGGRDKPNEGRRVVRACLNCRLAHKKCSGLTPCTRCVRMGIKCRIPPANSLKSSSTRSPRRKSPPLYLLTPSGTTSRHSTTSSTLMSTPTPEERVDTHHYHHLQQQQQQQLVHFLHSQVPTPMMLWGPSLGCNFAANPPASHTDPTIQHTLPHFSELTKALGLDGDGSRSGSRSTSLSSSPHASPPNVVPPSWEGSSARLHGAEYPQHQHYGLHHGQHPRRNPSEPAPQQGRSDGLTDPPQRSRGGDAQKEWQWFPSQGRRS
mgnify:FL=1